MSNYFSKLFLIYWCRWLISAVVMMPFMLLFDFWGLSLCFNLILGQSIGALIFFKIDEFIFKHE